MEIDYAKAIAIDIARGDLQSAKEWAEAAQADIDRLKRELGRTHARVQALESANPDDLISILPSVRSSG